MNKETGFSVLQGLLHRHDDAADHYREAAMIASDGELVEFLESLSNYRKELWKELNEIAEDKPPSPVPPSNKSKSFFTTNWAKMEEALVNNNRMTVSQICNDCENEISNYYKECLSAKNLEKELKKTLEKQHKRVLEVTRKTERMETVPSLKN